MMVFHVAIFNDYGGYLSERFAYDASLYDPILLLKWLHVPFGWLSGAPDPEVFRLGDDAVRAIFAMTVIAGLAGLVGFMTPVSMLVAAAGFAYTQAFVYSFGDFHHPEAILAVALGALALAPSGRVLSVDNWLRGRRGRAHARLEEGPFAGWPVKLIQWFFVLMYLSAVYAKFEQGGLDWMNGYTLQYYLALDGRTWGSDFAVWLSRQHGLVMLGQIGVVLFQATFALEVIFPPLRWIYVPMGIFLHTFIYVTLGAPFFVWIACYVVFIPWDGVAMRLREAALPGARART